MAEIQVSYEEMKASAQRLDRERDEITTKLQGLDQMIEQLVQGAFKTQTASPKFRESFAQWHSGARNAIEGMQGMSQFLNKAVEAHQQLDQSLASGTGQ